MKIKINGKRMFYAMTALALFASCQKNEMDLTSSESSLEDVIAVATSEMAATGSASGAVDSVYLLQACKQGETRNPISQADLPSAVVTYLADNYSGSVFSKAFALKNSTAAVTGYVVVIYFNDKPVGLQFDENGNFVKVLEQREKNDLRGAGHHQGGRFEHRDGRHRDTLALTSLPATVTANIWQPPLPLTR